MISMTEDTMELNNEELNQISGGWSICFLVGISNHPVASVCWVEGTTTGSESYGAFGSACAYVGVGFCGCT